MTQPTPSERESEPQAIALPCEQQHFAEFISGLLGKPQTISKRRTGVFDLGFDDIASFYHLVDQRVKQQNAASLVQFTVKVIYDDGASILHNSLESFQSYNEVRPVSATDVLLSWTYLITFPNKDAPEKQEIEVIFDTGRVPFFDVPDIPVGARMLPVRGGVSNVAFRVKHTEWTWGADIEGRLSAHIETLLATESQPKKWLRQHSGKIAFAFSILAIIAGIVCIYLNMQHFSEHQATLFAMGRDTSSSATDAVIDKLDRIQESLATGAWYRFTMTSFLHAGATLIIALVGGLMIGSVLDDKPPSFLRLTTQSEKQRELILKKSKRQWLRFAGAFTVAVVASVVANYAYAYLATPDRTESPPTNNR
ncbi:hypothetical protein, partial [Stieleria mannarensis]|uniref:hypothetical protein n=1 Tax=Stieleria mannarensis TaxID=2755585 RepID=UPI0015FFEA2F